MSIVKLEKTIVIFDINTLEFFNMQSFMQKSKYLNSGQRLHFGGIFGLEFEEVIVIFEIRTFDLV